MAGFGGSIALVSLLLKYGADSESRNGSGRTPLHVAASEGHEVVLMSMLFRGVDANQKDHDSRVLFLNFKNNVFTTSDPLSLFTFYLNL